MTSALDQEFVALAAEVFGDFRAFCGLLEIKLKDTNGDGVRAFGYDTWHEEQRRFDEERTGRDLILKPRQIGFSTLELARDLWFALTHTGVQVLVVSHDGDEVERMFQDVRAWVVRLVELRLIPKPMFSTKRELTWRFNRSTLRVVEAGQTEAAAKKKGRSGTVHRAHFTEVAFWGAAEETASAIESAVPSGGEIVYESTADGAAGMFFDMCSTAVQSPDASPYRFHFYPWFVHGEYRAEVGENFDPAPRDAIEVTLRAHACDDEQIAWWRLKVAGPGGVAKAKREYPIDPTSCFTQPGGAFIEEEVSARLTSEEMDPIGSVEVVVTSSAHVWKTKRLGTMDVYADPIPGSEYVIGADVSEGVGADESAFDVTDKRTGLTVAEFASNTIDHGDFGFALAWVGRRYNMATVAPERNNHGHTTLRAMRNEQTSVTPYHRVYIAPDGKEGWLTSDVTRPVMFDDLGQALRDGAIVSRSKAFASQTRTLIVNKRGKVVAAGKGQKRGARDDRWIAKAIAWQVRGRVKPSGSGKPAGQSRSDGFEGV